MSLAHSANFDETKANFNERSNQNPCVVNHKTMAALLVQVSSFPVLLFQIRFPFRIYWPRSFGLTTTYHQNHKRNNHAELLPPLQLFIISRQSEMKRSSPPARPNGDAGSKYWRN